MLTRSNNKGHILVEVLLAIALFTIIAAAILGGFVSVRDGKATQKQRALAKGHFDQLAEVLRSVKERDDGWRLLSAAGTYHIELAGSVWGLVDGQENIDGFIRKIEIADVCRNKSTGEIVLVCEGSDSALDPATKKITPSVSWGLLSQQKIYSSFYITRHDNNFSSVDTTEADFILGQVSGTKVVNSSDGAVQLDNNNRARWCSPKLLVDGSSNEINISLPDGPPVAVAARSDPANTAVPNDVLVATAPSADNSIKLAYVNVPADDDTPDPVLRGVFTMDQSKYSGGTFPSGTNLDNNFRTNDVKYYASSSGRLYALLATDKPDKEVVAVLVNDNNDSSASEFQDPANKIYKYQTFFNTRKYGSASGLDTGFINPTANSADTSSGDRNGYEGNPSNAYSNNSSYAVDTNSGNGTGTSCTGTDKDRHLFYNYGFSLPAGAGIDGIEVRLDARVDSANGSPKICIQLSWDGGASWTAAKSTPTLTTTQTSYYLGSASDSWGRAWSGGNLANSNFRVRVIDVSSNTSRDFSLDWSAVKVYYSGGVPLTNDQAPFGYGAKSITVVGDRGYVASGGYLYVFDLSNIDSQSPNNELNQIGCRIQLDGYDCNPETHSDKKYNAGETGTSWSDTTSPAHPDCSDGGNVELFADNDIAGVKVGSNNYIYTAVGAGTTPELDVVNATSVPTSSTSPSLTSNNCGRLSGGNSGWKTIGSLDFNSKSGTEEAANSVYSNEDGTRAYISSNGGIDGNNDGLPDSKQFYIINTTNKSSPAFLAGSPGSPTYGPTEGFYYGSSPDDELYPRQSLTVLNGLRAVLVGRDEVSNSFDAKEYQVLKMEGDGSESNPIYCGGVNFDSGFNDLVSVVEADSDSFVYMIANTPDKQLKIIQGGEDGTYMPSGFFESRVFDVGLNKTAMFNRVSADVSVPDGTTLSFKVASYGDGNQSCDLLTPRFLGPGGTEDVDDVYSIDGQIVYYDLPSPNQNPARCFKYRVEFMSDSSKDKTPVLNSFKVNYSL